MIQDAGYKLSESGYNVVMQNLMYPIPPPISQGNKPSVATHVAFFGRLEVGKGLILFLNALDLLLKRPEADKVTTISFIGAEVRVFGKRSKVYIEQRRRSKKW